MVVLLALHFLYILPYTELQVSEVKPSGLQQCAGTRTLLSLVYDLRLQSAVIVVSHLLLSGVGYYL